MCYAQAGIIRHTTNILAEAQAILEVVRYWESERSVGKILEIDSLTMFNIISSNWKIHWEIVEVVEEIQRHIK